MDRNSFVFYKVFRDCLKKWGAKVRLEVLEALIDYALNGDIPEGLSDEAESIFMLFKERIDNDLQAVELSGKRRRAAQARWNAKENFALCKSDAKENFALCKSVCKSDAKENFALCKSDAKENFALCIASPKENKEGDKEKVTQKEIIQETKEKEKTITKVIVKKKNFVKPSIAEIASYCKERNNAINPEIFYNFYESKGWVVGKSPMQDWKAAVRTWEQKERATPQAPLHRKEDPHSFPTIKPGQRVENYGAGRLEDLINDWKHKNEKKSN